MSKKSQWLSVVGSVALIAGLGACGPETSTSSTHAAASPSSPGTQAPTRAPAPATHSPKSTPGGGGSPATRPEATSGASTAATTRRGHGAPSGGDSTPPAAPATGGEGASPTGAVYPNLLVAFDDATTVSASSYPGKVTPVGFRTYVGDMSCGFAHDTVTCQLRADPAYTPPLDCHGAGVPGVKMTAGEDPRFTCMGDVESGGGVMKDALILAVGDLQCVSRSAGVTCVDGKGHGFRYGTKSYSLTGSSGHGQG